MPLVPVARLRDLAVGMLTAVGTRPDDAELVGEALIDANLTGHDSHGVIRLLNYVDWVQQGSIDPTARACLLSRQQSTAVVDARWGWGQVAMMLTVETVIDLARGYGSGAVAVRRSNHIGRVAPYVAKIAEAGMVGLAITNANPAVAPYGGRRRVFGTNPIAWGVPRAGRRSPVVHDIATAGVAEGKLRVARAKGVRVAPGLLLDADGEPTENPDDFYAGGTLLPFGGHKGSGLSVLVQILGRGLAGAGPEGLGAHRGGNGPVVIALNISAFTDLETFTEATEAICTEIQATPPATGFDDVLLPGELEERTERERRAVGIPLPETTWSELQKLAADLGVGISMPTAAAGDVQRS
ncbi:MAG: Ldh family oxidoreductase [Chloroflexota bacterium]|nr:Ldh family oxidoreductase [Chloroflexota bacterium]